MATTDESRERLLGGGPADNAGDTLMAAAPQRASYREVWVGFLVIAGILSGLIALFTLTDAATFRGRYIVTAVVDDAGGIRSGDPVRMRGVNIGRVQRFEMVPDGVAIRLELEDEYPVPADSRVVLRSGGLLGGVVAQVVPGSSESTLEGGDVLEGARDEGLIDAADEIGEKADAVLGNMQELLSARTVSAVQSSATEMQTLLARLSAAVGAQRREVEAISGRLSRASAGLERAAAGPELERSVARLDSLMRRMNRTSESLERASSSLDVVLERVARGEGTLGRLSTDESLYIHLDRAVQNLDLLVRDMREDPRRYFDVRVF